MKPSWARGWPTNAARVAVTLLVGCLAAACHVLEPPVARSVDGVVSEGRFIDPDAYALYAVAALREARGQWHEALTLYQRAFDLDGRGPELRTRIGAVACKLRQTSIADRAFAAALRADADYGPLWFELALCKQSRRDLAGAQSAALKAIELDPERDAASLLAASLAEQRGDRREAWRIRDALATHAPDSLDVQRAISAAALRDAEPARALRAQAALDTLAARLRGPLATPSLAGALSALERGDVAQAQRTAALLLGADPTSGDALVVALAAADLNQDHQVFHALLAQASEPGTPASPSVLKQLAALLGRRVSAQAAQLVQPQP